MSRILPNRIPTFQEIKEARYICSLEEDSEFFEQLGPFVHRLHMSDPKSISLQWDIRDYNIVMYVSWLYPNNPKLEEITSLFNKLARCLEVMPSSLRLGNYHEYADIEVKGNWIAFTYTGLASSRTIWEVILYCFTQDVNLIPDSLHKVTECDGHNIDLGVGLVPKRLQSE